MDRSFFGTDMLVDKLKVVFMGHLRHYLPSIYRNIKEKLKECSKNLEELGMNNDFGLLEVNQLSSINNLVNRFCDSVERTLNGKKVSINEDPLNGKIRTYYINFLNNFRKDYFPSKNINVK